MATLDGNVSTDVTICLTGPECTGKTTLAQALGAHFDAPLVTEVARSYLADRESYGAADLLAIVQAQAELEVATRAAHRGLMVCDTDLLVLQIWWQEKFGTLPAQLQEALKARSPRSYLLLRPDLPWVDDPQRENPFDRERLFELYQRTLEASGFAYAVVGGTGPDRFDAALRAIHALNLV